MIFETAGRAGLDPDPYTFRELVWLADGRSQDEWNRASLLAALVFNQNRKRSDMKDADQFNPYRRRRRRGRPITKSNINDLKIFLR